MVRPKTIPIQPNPTQDLLKSHDFGFPSALFEALNSLIGNKYGGNFLLALQAVYPHHEWHAWRFPQTPAGFWAEPVNQRKYFDWLAKQLDFKSHEDWYHLEKPQIVETGGLALVQNYFRGSIPSAVMSSFPEHKFLPWKFTRVENHFWKTRENRRAFFDWLGQQLGVTRFEDWYQFEAADLLPFGARVVLSLHYKSSIALALSDVYREHQWLDWRFRTPRDRMDAQEFEKSNQSKENS